MTAHQEKHSEQQARLQLEGIKEMVAALRCDYARLAELRDDRRLFDPQEGTSATWEESFPDDAEELKALEEQAGECDSEDAAREMIQQDPLSLQVRGGWHTPGDDDDGPDEYELLLCTGGPACRIVGKLDSHGEPETARIEHQDWGTLWTDYPLSGDDEATVLVYASCFYFGD